MPLRRRRRRRYRSNLYFRPMSRPKRAFIIFLFILFVLSIVCYGMLLRLRPIMVKLALTEVNDLVMLDIYDVIDDEIANGSLSYDNLITLEKDYSGNITALETNMPMVNLMQTRISKEIVAKKNSDVTDIKIPIGNALGGEFFTGRGPLFVVKILSVTDVQTQFVNSFTEAGINQTHHSIILEVSAVIDLYVPGSKETTTTVTTRVVVAETVIVGEVPNVYADIGDGY